MTQQQLAQTLLKPANIGLIGSWTQTMNQLLLHCHLLGAHCNHAVLWLVTSRASLSLCQTAALCQMKICYHRLWCTTAQVHDATKNLVLAGCG